MNKIALLFVILLSSASSGSLAQTVLNTQDISIKALEFSNDKKYMGWVHLHANEVKVVSVDSTWSINLGSSSGGIRSITFHPSQPILAMGFYNGIIELWNFREGRLLWSIQGHEKQVNDLKISRAGDFIISVGNDKTIRCFWVENGEFIKMYTHTSLVNAVELHPTRPSQFVTGDHEGNIIYWKINSLKKMKIVKAHDSYIFDLAFFGRGDTLVSASHDKTVKAWSYYSGDNLKTFAGHSRAVFSLDVTSKQTIVSGSFDQKICIWNFASDQPRTCYKGHTDYINVVRVAANGDIVSGSRDGTVRLWKK